MELKTKKTIYLLFVLAAITYLSVAFGDFLKNYNPWFKDWDIYHIIMLLFTFCLVAFSVIYHVYDYIKKRRGE